MLKIAIPQQVKTYVIYTLLEVSLGMNSIGFKTDEADKRKPLKPQTSGCLHRLLQQLLDAF